MNLTKVLCKLTLVFILNFQFIVASQFLSNFEPKAKSEDVIAGWMSSLENLYERAPRLLHLRTTKPEISYEDETLKPYFPMRMIYLNEKPKMRKRTRILRTEDKAPKSKNKEKRRKRRKNDKKRMAFSDSITRKPVDIIVHIKMKEK